MKKKYFVLLLLSIVGSAQELKQDQANWFAYVGQYNVSKKWGYHIEAQFRLDNDLSRNNQTLFRLGGFYNLNSKITVKAGYGLINTLNATLNDYFNEDRIWEELQYNHKWNENKNAFINRFRLEQRFVDKLAMINGGVEKVETNYQNRFRYLNRHTFHLTNFRSGNEELYFVVQDELFLNLGNNNVNNAFFDQNRFLIGLGFNYKNSIQFEVTYMNQLMSSNSANDSMNHIVSLTLYQNLILYKEKK